MNSKDYWLKREEEALKHRITEEAEYNRQIKQIYQDMLDACQKEIDSFYAKYASKEGITIAEAKKRVNKLDIAAYERKARRYVRDKDFSAKANEEMRLYNATMKINRLEMLKANIGLELISGHDELEKFMEKILKGRTEDELKRQAGILGKTVRNNAQKAHAIVNGSFHSGTFSDRIWQYQDLMREDLGRMLQTGLIQGKNPRTLAKDLKKYWFGNDPLTGGGARYCMERLMRTELARVQTEAQKQSFVRNGFDRYMFIVNGGCCPLCEEKDGKDFAVAKMMPGTNAPPMHPNCRCSTAAYEDSKEYEAWLDYLDKGGSTEEWNKKKSSVSEKKKPIEQGIFSTFNITKADSVRPKSIMNEMNKSELGRSLMEYLEKENVPVHLCYGVDNPNGNCGSYDPFDDVITIFCDVTKTAKDTASTLVHEATHRKLGSKGTFDEEVECFKAELIHKKGTLTKSEIYAIMDHVKKYYPELE